MYATPYQLTGVSLRHRQTLLLWIFKQSSW